MKKQYRWIMTAVLVLLCGAGALYFMNMPFYAETYTVSKGEAKLYFTEQGYVVSSEKTEVYPLVEGEVLSVHVEEKQYVNKGDIICVIDATHLETQKALALSEMKGYGGQITNLDLAERQEKDAQRINLKALEGEYNALLTQESDISFSKEEQLRLQHIVVEQNRREKQFADEELARAEVLYDNGVISTTELEAFTNGAAAAASNLDGSLKQLDIISAGEIGTSEEYLDSLKASLKSQIDSINNYLEKTYTSGLKQYYAALLESGESQIALLEKQIGDSVVKAPVSGIITELYIKDTNIASGQFPVAVITADIEKEIEVYVSTKDIAEVALGDTVELTFKKQTEDVPFQGRVKYIDGEAVVRMSSLGVEERRVKALIEPFEPEGVQLGSGYDVDVRFITYVAQDKVAVPKTALFKYEGNDYVFVVENGKAMERLVETGVELRTQYVVETGLSEGDVVVRDADTSGLKEGVRIKID